MKIDSPNAIGITTIDGNLTVTGTTSVNALTSTSSTVNGNLTVTGTTNISTLTTTASTVNGNLTVTGTTNTGALTASTLNLTTIGSGTSVTNLGITSGGAIVTGSTMFPATYIMAQNGSGQIIPTNVQTTITNWANITAINASEWNPTTGVFTATKDGTYLVSGNITYAAVTDTLNIEYAVNVFKNGVSLSQGRNFVQLNQTGASFKQTNAAVILVSVVAGDTLGVAAGQFSGSDRALHTNGNTITIQELPRTVTR